MRRLEILKGISALGILGTTYNAYFDLLAIPRLYELHLALSLLCVLLFLVGLYHDQLSRRLMQKAREEAQESFRLDPQASRDLLFREGLIGFLLFLPVIPSLLKFPEQPYLGLSLFLFPLHGLLRGYRMKWMKGLYLVIGSERIAFPLRSTRSIRFTEIQKVAVKYEHLYFILKNDSVETFPLDHLPPNDKGNALRSLGEKMKEKGIKGSDTVQELDFS
ncbi:MAG: hypothetical protein ABEH38_00795 [Flavobacteriales bacterium]